MVKKGLIMSVNVCIPVLNAYDDFWKCIESILKSSVDCGIYVIDNGGKLKESTTKFMSVYKPPHNLGVAASWNWFIDNVPENRIITNDDVEFEKHAIEKMVEAHNRSVFLDLVCPVNIGTPFSCFLLPDAIIKDVGNFDEWISPRYAYFEDNDFSYRMSLKGYGIIKAEGSMVTHVGSSTLKHFNKKEEIEHHEKFVTAREHYVKKWGGQPGEEKFTEPFGKKT